MIMQCPKCKEHDYQDKKYGKFMRVHNPCKSKSAGMISARCTICTNVKDDVRKDTSSKVVKVAKK